MKKIIIILGIVCKLNANAQQKGDTVIIIHNKKEIIIKSVEGSANTNTSFTLVDSTKNSKVKILVNFSDKKLSVNDTIIKKDTTDFSVKETVKIIKSEIKKSKKKSNFSVNYFNEICFGFIKLKATTNQTSNININNNINKSYFISTNFVKLNFNFANNRLALNTAIGYNYLNIANSKIQTVNFIDATQKINQYTDTINKFKTNLHSIFYLTIPLMLDFNSKNEKFGISAGIEYNFKINSSYNQRGRNDYGKFSYRIDKNLGFSKNLVTGVVKVKFNNFWGVYSKISLTDLYQSKYLLGNGGGAIPYVSNQQLFTFGICLL